MEEASQPWLENWLLSAGEHVLLLLTVLPVSAHQASWRSGRLPTMVISILLFFLPGDQDLPQVHPWRAPGYSLAISPTGHSLGRSESREKSQSLCRGVGRSEGLGTGGCLLGVGVPLLFSLAFCSGLDKSKVLFWPGARLSDGPRLAGLRFSLAVGLLFTAFCPERATVSGGAEDFLFLPHCGQLTMPTPEEGAAGIPAVPWESSPTSALPATTCVSRPPAAQFWAPTLDSGALTWEPEMMGFQWKLYF